MELIWKHSHCYLFIHRWFTLCIYSPNEKKHSMHDYMFIKSLVTILQKIGVIIWKIESRLQLFVCSPYKAFGNYAGSSVTYMFRQNISKGIWQLGMQASHFTVRTNSSKDICHLKREMSQFSVQKNLFKRHKPFRIADESLVCSDRNLEDIWHLWRQINHLSVQTKLWKRHVAFKKTNESLVCSGKTLQNVHDMQTGK